MFRTTLPCLYALLTAVLLGFGLEYYTDPSWKMPTGMVVCLNGISLVGASLAITSQRLQGISTVLASLAIAWIGIMFIVAFGHLEGIPVTTIGDHVFGSRMIWAVPAPFVWYVMLWVLLKVGDAIDDRVKVARG